MDLYIYNISFAHTRYLTSVLHQNIKQWNDGSLFLYSI